MTPRERSLAAARAAVGVRFRLHGRTPEFGLDCVGLAGLALRAAGCTVDLPTGYALRGGTAAGMLALAERRALMRVAVPLPGDPMLFAVGPAQFHVGIRSDTGMVHADAMLRRVVERPGPAPWPMIAAWMPIEDGGEG